MTVYPVPYYILAFVLLMLFAYYIPIFPLVGGDRGDLADLGLYWQCSNSRLSSGAVDYDGRDRLPLHYVQGAVLD